MPEDPITCPTLPIFILDLLMFPRLCSNALLGQIPSVVWSIPMHCVLATSVFSALEASNSGKHSYLWVKMTVLGVIFILINCLFSANFLTYNVTVFYFILI